MKRLHTATAKISELVLPLIVSTALAACSTDKESMSVFLAKEMCSCLFLLERSEAQCKGALSFSLALGEITTDRLNKEVTASAKDGSFPITFKFESTTTGCGAKPLTRTLADSP